MHKLGRGKTVLIYAGKKGTHTHAAVRIIFSINACTYIVYNMYAEDNANSSPKNNTLVGLCNFFRFVLFASFPPDVSSVVYTYCCTYYYTLQRYYNILYMYTHHGAYIYICTFGDNLKHYIPARYSVPLPRLLGGTYARRVHSAIYVYTTKRG